MTIDVHAETPSTSISQKAGGFALPGWRPLLAGPLVAATSLGAALIATGDAGIPLRDPDNVTGNRLVMALSFILSLFVIDVVVRAWSRSEGRLPTRAALLAVRREHWTLQRWLAVAGAIVAFYVTYLAYRNLKSVVPLLREENFDGRLADLDRSLFAGSDPAGVLHSLLGSGVSAYALSGVYELFFVFIPVALAFALVVLADLRAGLFLTTALAINWALAAVSYFMLPSLGPIYATPADFVHLPVTGVSGLQDALLDQRTEFLRDPTASGAAQSIGAFASLHVSIFFTAALATLLLELGRFVKIGVWVLFALTVVATIYFGWHYVLDDVAGLVIAVAALALAWALTGLDLRPARRPLPARV